MDDVVVLGVSSARHTCKVCRKGFPCGRSLGGHMRSHSLAEVAMAAAAADDDEDESRTRGAYNSVVDSGGGGYELCHADRGELLPSLKPVLDGGDYNNGEQDGAAPEDDEEAECMLVPTEAAVLMPAPRRRRRSMRVPAPAPPPAAAFDREPEDVALCLIMLSRDTPGRLASPPVTTYGKKRRDSAAAAARNGGYYYHNADSDDASHFFQYDDVEITKNKRRKPAPCLAGDERRGRYECPGCGRAFQSYQALGGHRASHKRINSNCSIAKIALDQPEPSVETNTSFSTASAPASPEVDRAAAVNAKKMSSKFECPVCFKVFASGQALGGHKRSHSIAGELCERANAGIVEPDHALVAAQFLDLNLPAPGADD